MTLTERGLHRLETARLERKEPGQVAAILINAIEHFKAMKGDRQGFLLYEWSADSPDGIVYDYSEGVRKYKVEKEGLKEGASEALRQNFGIRETGQRPKTRSKISDETHRSIKGSYTEYKTFESNTAGLNFQSVTEKESEVPVSEYWKIADIHTAFGIEKTSSLRLVKRK